MPVSGGITKLRRVIVGLILVAFTLRAFVPAGYMFAPAQADEGGLTVVICTAQGFQHITLEAQGAPTETPSGDRRGEACDYGTLPISFHSDTPQIVLASQVLEEVEHSRLTAFILSAKLKTVRLARGPPSLISV